MLWAHTRGTLEADQRCTQRRARAGLEMQGTRIDGTVLVILARLSVNLNALTIEQAPPSSRISASSAPCDASSE